MATLNTTGALLAQDKVDRYRPFGAFGKPAYQSHVQLRAMLLSRPKLGLKYANYFAKPVYEPQSGMLRWLAECPGVARALSALDADERQIVFGIQKEIDDELNALIGTLRKQAVTGASGMGAYASLLEQARKIPSRDGYVHVVGQQPVISFWGFETQQGFSVEATAPPLGDAPFELEFSPAPAPQGVDQEKKRPWWNKLLSRDTVPVAPDTRGLVVGEQISIPANAFATGDLSFLVGMWQFGDGLLDIYQGDRDNVTGQERCTFSFVAKGKGYKHSTERTRNGAPMRDNSAPARAAFLRLGLQIEWDELVDWDGLTMMKGQMECELTPDGRTVCYVVNDDGHRWVTELFRLT